MQLLISASLSFLKTTSGSTWAWCNSNHKRPTRETLQRLRQQAAKAKLLAKVKAETIWMRCRIRIWETKMTKLKLKWAWVRFKRGFLKNHPRATSLSRSTSSSCQPDLSTRTERVRCAGNAVRCSSTALHILSLLKQIARTNCSAPCKIAWRCQK